MFEPNTTQPKVFEDALARMESATRASEALNWVNAAYSMRGVAAVFTFLKPVGSEAESEEGEQTESRQHRKIQVMAAFSSVAEIIINFHSSMYSFPSHPLLPHHPSGRALLTVVAYS